ncbi:hypothetical protein [Wenxinia marina]|uniref:Uncharacterized protein n=1 Tax=Wenxinia marina DSM 24838 TaxID=1123501 RepID=A0A0D0PBD2_9RHOB|nr:hypothetical protein [Wenxinia marina]KIQ68711.1 hypothetical protein Wenmar_02435 [Wenxinia marina DSM 24838]GGL65846.1 hypothetical protein GCM10011392_20600 [Wenxinia marina]
MATTDRESVEALAEKLRITLRAIATTSGEPKAAGRLGVNAYLTMHLLLDERDLIWNEAIEAAAVEVETSTSEMIAAAVAPAIRMLKR